jgi:hypothetical protein
MIAVGQQHLPVGLRRFRFFILLMKGKADIEKRWGWCGFLPDVRGLFHSLQV